MRHATTGSKPEGMGAFKYELLLLLVFMIWGSAFVAQQISMEKGLGPITFNGRPVEINKDGLVVIEAKPGEVLVVSEGARH